MSPYYFEWDSGYGSARVFIAEGTRFSGHLGWAGVQHAEGVVRPSNFSLIKFFHN